MAFKQLLRGSLGDPKDPGPPKDAGGRPRTAVLYLTADARESRLVNGAFNFAHPHLQLDLSVALKEARAHLAQPAKYDALVIGWSVPQNDGASLIAHVREQRYPIAVVASGESLDSYREAGADQCVPKGGSFLARLPVAIDEAIKKRRAVSPAPAPPASPAPADAKGLRVAFAGDMEPFKADLATAASPLQVVPLSQALAEADVRARNAALDFDLVLIDHGAPNTNTAALLADVRARNLSVPIVLLVSPMEERSALQIFGPTVDEYLAKTTGWLARISIRLDGVLARQAQVRELAALRVKEARLRSMVDRLPACILRLSAEGTVLAGNAVAVSMLNAPGPNALVRKPFETFVHDEDREHWSDFFKRVCGGEQRSIEVRVSTLDGTERVLEVSAVPVPAELGRDSSVLMVLRDASDRKRLEAAVEQITASPDAGEAAQPGAAPAPGPDPALLRELESGLHRLSGQARTTFEELGALLRDAEARHDEAFTRQADEYARLKAAQLEHWRSYEQFVQGAAHGVFRASLSSRLLDANSALASALGYDSPDQLAAAAHSIGAMTNEEEWQAAVEGWRAGGARQPVELLWRRKDRSLATLRLRGRLVADVQREGECLEVIAEDVSAQRALEAQLRRARRWEDAARVTAGIAADLSHVIVSLSEASERLAADSSRGAGEHAQTIQVAAARALALSRQLVAFGRREARGPSALDLNDVVRQMEPVVRRLVDEHIELKIALAPGLEPAEAARPVVEDTFVTLVLAARDVLPAGGQIAIDTGGIELDREQASARGVEPGAYVQLSLTATGWGIDGAIPDRLSPGADRDNRVAATRRAVMQHGGSVTVDIVPETSLTFDVYLPRTSGAGAFDGETPVPMEAL
jgi:PAS domain S-box-containing protein